MVRFDFDRKKNIESIRNHKPCSPEGLGIFNKDLVEQYIIENFGVTPQWKRHHFILSYNDNYDVDVNHMLRSVCKNLFGKEDKIKEMQEKFSVTTTLEIVPYIVSDSDEPKQILSLDRDIIDFLSLSNTTMDLDYYII